MTTSEPTNNTSNDGAKGVAFVRSRLSLVDIRSNGFASGYLSENKRFINEVIIPTTTPTPLPAAYVNWWDSIDAAKTGRIVEGDSIDTQVLDVAPIFLCGECDAISAVTTYLQESCDSDLYYEIDMSSMADEHAQCALVGVAPGYLHHDTEGSPLVKFLKKARKISCEQSGYQDAPECPTTVLVFKNVHLAHSTSQAVLATIAEGSISLSTGEKYDITNSIVVFTAPGVYPMGDAGESDAVLSGLRELVSIRSHVQTPMFSPQLLLKSKVVYFHPPTICDLLAITSYCIGNMLLQAWLETGVKTTNRHYGDSALCRYVIGKAHLINGMSWKAKIDAIQQSVYETLSSPVFRDRETVDVPSISYGTLWSMTNVLNTFITTQVSLDDIQEEIGSYPLPVDFIESNGLTVPPSAYWGDCKDLGNNIGLHIYGQDAVISDLVATISTRLNNTMAGKPLVTTLLVGPTGSGKTELPNVVARVTNSSLFTLNGNTISTAEDMSSHLFGRGEGTLFTHVRRHPNSVILFDEVDKAHKSFWYALLTAFDTGVLSDNETGASLCLRHCMVFLASNYLAEELATTASTITALPSEEKAAAIRKMLSRCAGIDTPCVERLDSVHIMLPLEGVNAYPLWHKFFKEALPNIHSVAPNVVAWAEMKHIDHGGVQGARARKRAVAALLPKIGVSDLFLQRRPDNSLVLSLTQATALVFAANSGGRSERERLWGLPPTIQDDLAVYYKGNCWQTDMSLATIRASSKKKTPRGPVATILLCGKSGSGKTYFGESLSRALKKGEAIKIDCQQFVTQEQISSALFGDIHGNEGMLTHPFLSRKDRVVIFDEFMRGHRSLLSQIMGILDTGIATDIPSGLPVDMKQAVFILTSNECEDEITQQIFNKNISGVEAESTMRQIISQADCLTPEILERINLVLPLSPPTSGSNEDLFASGVITQAAAEFALPQTKVEEVIRVFLETRPITGGNAREIRRWTDIYIGNLLK